MLKESPRRRVLHLSDDADVMQANVESLPSAESLES